MTIAKGSGGAENMSAATCSKTNGYGDAALVALPNGDLMCTMVHGYRISGNDRSKPTTNWYTVSHDNGQTWSALKQIPANLYKTYRGCIAPGNMLLVGRGSLKGKVLACFRSYAKRNGAVVQGNFFLCYDPAQDSWSRITASGTGVQKDGRLNITGTADYAYYLLNGAQHQFASDADITTHAIAASNWYSGTLPVLVSNMVFNNLADPEHSVDGKTSPYMIVDLFVVNNDVNKSYKTLMSELASDKGYVYKVSHWFAPNYDATVTAVSQVEAARAVRSVTYYNLAGMSSATPFDGVNVAVTRYTDGSTTACKVIK